MLFVAARTVGYFGGSKLSFFFSKMLSNKKEVKVKVQQSHYRPGLTQRVPGS
jgi:hypothetical protein